MQEHSTAQLSPEIQQPRSLPCTFCSRGFETESILFHHVRNDHREEWEMFCRGRPLQECVLESQRDQFICPICGKAYINEKCLRKHVANHPEVPHRSQPSTASSAVAAAAAAAIVAASNSTIRSWPCTICETVFPQEAGLLQHLRQKIHDEQHRFVAQYLLDHGSPLPPPRSVISSGYHVGNPYDREMQDLRELDNRPQFSGMIGAASR